MQVRGIYEKLLKASLFLEGYSTKRQVQKASGKEIHDWAKNMITRTHLQHLLKERNNNE
jgi:hypothetical protein